MQKEILFSVTSAVQPAAISITLSIRRTRRRNVLRMPWFAVLFIMFTFFFGRLLVSPFVNRTRLILRRHLAVTFAVVSLLCRMQLCRVHPKSSILWPAFSASHYDDTERHSVHQDVRFFDCNKISVFYVASSRKPYFRYSWTLWHIEWNDFPSHHLYALQTFTTGPIFGLPCTHLQRSYNGQYNRIDDKCTRP